MKVLIDVKKGGMKKKRAGGWRDHGRTNAMRDGWAEEEADGLTDGRTAYEQQMYEWADEWTDGRIRKVMMDGRTGGPAHRWSDRRTDGRIYGTTER